MRSLFLLLCCIIPFFGINQNEDLLAKLDSLKQVVENSDNISDTTTLSAYLNASEYLFNHNPDSALYLCKRIIKEIENHKEKDEQALSKMNAIRSGAYNNIGVYYFYKGDVEKTVDYFTQSYELDKATGNLENAAETINNIGFVYQEYGNSEFAIKYFNEAMEIHKKNDDQKGVATCLNNIGLIYFKNKEYKKSLELFNQSIDIENEIGNDDGRLINYENIAAVYRETGDLDRAYTMYQYALTLNKNNRNNVSTSLTYHHLSIIDLEKNRLKQAEFNGEKSLLYAEKANSDASIRITTGALWEVYKAEKKWKKALTTFQIYTEIDKKINSNELDNVLLEQELKYNFEQEEQKIALEHKNELAILETNQEKQKIITWSISAFLILILILAFVIIRKLKEAKKQKSIIEEKNSENELLLGEIHHRVKNNLQVISSLLSLQERSITDEGAKSAILEGKERVQSMGLIHKLLYQKNNFAGIEMKEYVEKLVDGLLDSFGKSNDEFNIKINFSEINLDVDTAIPIGLMINELVINSLKYAYDNTKNPSLSIQIKEENKQLILEVEDNGSGTVKDVTESKSFGLKLIRSLSRQLSGVFDVEKRIGLCFTIRMNDYKIID